ncbi:Serine carboxypeptidase [Ceratobasidium sp. AG-Ba]|nr:Serine carboxypeptidase [Ceratobasidium sp. AG-Ba]
MRTMTLAAALVFTATAASASLPPEVARLRNALGGSPVEGSRALRPRGESVPRAPNHTFQASDFLVNSSALPFVRFPLQDSYAGRLPISSKKSETKQLSFWYWPSSAAGVSNKLSIWLNGGPGCSSFIGFLTENGPISFKAGTILPAPNPYAWTTESDMASIVYRLFVLE